MDDESVEQDAGNKNRKYEVEAIQDSEFYTRELESGQLSGLYYLVLWKIYLEEENIWEPASAVPYLRKLINLFHKDHPNKLTTTSPAIDTVPPMARPRVKLAEPPKQK